MQKWILVIFAIFVITACDSKPKMIAQAQTQEILDYKNEDDQFTIVVLMDKITKKEAKQKAMKRAARVSYDNGFKYFIIINEENVKVMPGKEGWPSAYDFPQNLYQEEIVEKGYNRERFIQGSKENFNTYPALKIEIKALKQDRSSAYRVCSLIECK